MHRTGATWICAVFVCLQLCSVSARAASTAGLTGSLTGGMAGGLDLWRSWSDGNLSHISVGAELGRPPKPSKLPKTASLPNIYQYYASTRIFAKSRDTVRQMLICLVVIKQCYSTLLFCKKAPINSLHIIIEYLHISRKFM